MSKKGFSLIEVIVIVAITAIIGTPLLGIFTRSYKNVISYGHRTKIIFEAQKEMDKRILCKTESNTQFDIIENPNDSLKLELYNSQGILEIDKSIIGKKIQVKYKTNPITITTFVP